MSDCDFNNDAMTCPRCGFKAGGRDWRKNCKKAPKRIGPCVHRGEETRRQECETCSGRQQIKVFACPKHGECTIGKPLPDIACCATCGDYEAAEPSVP